MKLRFKITKDKEIRFISHLEYMKAITRAIRRAKLPVAYSEGFNPHLKFSLASALGVGVASYTEFAEMEMAEPVEPEMAAKALSRALPNGIRVLAADAVDTHHAALMSQAAGASYKVTLPVAKNISEAVAAFNGAETLMFRKAAPKLKAGYKEVDVKSFIPFVREEYGEGCLALFFDIKITSTGSMKAVDLLNALNENFAVELPVEKADIERLDLYRLNKNNKKIPMLNSDAYKML